MISFTDALILGIIQGTTEWLPISSSAHLALAQNFLNSDTSIVYDVVLHIGTLLALLVYFRNDLYKLILGVINRQEKETRLALLIIICSISTAIIGFLFRDYFESIFFDMTAIGVTLAINGIIIILATRFKGTNTIDMKSSFLVGIAQGISVSPGISRSGATISTAMFLGVEKNEAAKFSFLASIVPILGVSILEGRKAFDGSIEMLPLVVGFITSAIIGYLSIKLLFKFLKESKFQWFGYYCIVLAFLVLISSNLDQQDGLNSNYFKGDDDKIGEQGITWSNEKTIQKDKFDYKIISALRMLGYNFEKDKKDTKPTHVRALEQFKENSGLAVDSNTDSEIITKETLVELDNQIKLQEEKSILVAQRFSLNKHVVIDHPNGITKEFISAMIVNSLEALPSDLVDLGKENMLTCYIRQCSASAGNNIKSFIFEKGTNDQIQFVPTNDNFDFYEARFLGSKTESSVNLERLLPLYIETTVIIHEYAHYLDSAVYPKKQGTKQGIMDTEEFYKISFENVEELGVFPIYSKVGTLNIKSDLDQSAFIDSYAMSRAGKGYVEDFAESFATYVVSGNSFREKAQKNEVLKQKYDWLKENVFNGVEYDTDLPRVKSNYEYVFDGELKKLQ